MSRAQELPELVPEAALSAAQIVDLGARLRREGFRVTTQQCLLAQLLMLRLAAVGRLPDTAYELATRLGPIFCSAPDEQTRFTGLYRTWCAGQFPGLVDRSIPAPVQPALSADAPTTVLGGWRRKRRILAWLLVVAIAAGFGTFLRERSLSNLQQPLEGSVRLADGGPAIGAWVRLRDRDGGEQESKANADGRFRLLIRPRELTGNLRVGLEGYLTENRLVSEVRLQDLEIVLRAVKSPETNGVVEGSGGVRFQGAVLRHELHAPRHWRQLLLPIGLAALPIALLLAWWSTGWAWRRRRGPARLQRALSTTPERLREIHLPGGARRLLPGLGVRELARELRRPRLVHSLELDTAATLTATLHHGGFITPVFGSRVEPDYLVLVDSIGLHDHHAALAHSLIAGLLEGYVSVERYVFDGDPEYCRRVDAHTGVPAPRSVSLGELAVRFAQHRLLMFTDTAGFFEPFTGQPAHWLRLLDAWPDKVVLTPEPPEHWGRREVAVSRLGLPLLPLSRAGLMTVSSLFRGRGEAPQPPPEADEAPPRLFDHESSRWLDREPPAPDVVARLIADLEQDLGQMGFQWLAACAVYPETHWGITVRLGATLVPDPTEFGAHLPRLARLPWLREGYLPDWFRAALLAQLPSDIRDRIHRELLALLDPAILETRSPLPLRIAAGSPADAEAQTGWLRRLGRRLRPAISRLTFRQALAQAPAGSPLQDYVFLRFLGGQPVSPLCPTAPRRFEAWLYPDGLRMAGTRRSLALGCCAGLSVPLFLLAWSRLPPWPAIGPVALSPDARTLAFGDEFGRILLYDTADGTLAGTLIGHDGWVLSLAFDHTGALLVSAGQDGTVNLWNPTARRLDRTLTGHAGSVFSVAVDPQGELAASSGDEPQVRLWNIATGQLLHSLEGHQSPVHAVAFDAEQGYLASGSSDGTVRIWEPSSGQLLTALAGHTGSIMGLAFDGQGRFLASGGLDGTIRTWEVNRLWDVSRMWDVNAPPNSDYRPWNGHTGGVLGLALGLDGSVVVSGGRDERVRLWEAATGRMIHTLQGSTNSAVIGVAFVAQRPPQPGVDLTAQKGANPSDYDAPQESLLAAAYADGVVRLWTMEFAPPGAPLTVTEQIRQILEVRVRQIIAEQLGIEPAQINPQSRFIEDLRADSLDLVELVMALEEEFQINIPDEYAMNLLTVGDAIAYLEANNASAEPGIPADAKGARPASDLPQTAPLDEGQKKY